MQRRDIDFVKMLLAFGADINPLNEKKNTPLDLSVGKYGHLDRTDSLVEIVEIPLVCGLASMMNFDELGTLLRDCGAMLSCSLACSERKKLGCFVAFGGREEKSEAGSLPLEKVAREGDDWCTKISKMYFKLETGLGAMLEDVNTLLVSDSLDTAAALGIQIREMKLLQTGGSRILFLDGGGMKGLVEIEVLCQLERRTGRKITDLFDWIVGTSTGAIIALGLVHGKELEFNAKICG